jgi:hypothetical protein
MGGPISEGDTASRVGSGAGEPPINFQAHLQRTGERGASTDFEQMLAQLVAAVEGDEAHLVFPNPGDWGIDVVVGNLNDRVRIWQAKYFARGVREGQQGQIDDSFQSALRAAGRNGYRVERWTLCIPCSMDAPALRWWQGWRARQAASGVDIVLWDENRLRQLLMRPEAEAIRRAYYHPYRERRDLDPPRPPAAPVVPDTRAARPDQAWHGGDELRLGESAYLLHGEPAVEHPPDRAWLSHQATAEQIEPRPGRVWLHQVRALTPARQGAGRRAALRAQARLLTSLEGISGMPRLLDVHETEDATTIVVARPSGPTWRERYGTGLPPGDLFSAGAVLGAAAHLCTALAELHRRGHSHRALAPDAILLVDGGRRAIPRDLGLAAIPAVAGEGRDPYRAPEQASTFGVKGPPGKPADTYQVAAIVYETLTGGRPARSGPLPVRATVNALPPTLDELLLQALDADPRQRPKDIRVLAAALRAAPRQISRGGTG